MVEYLPIKKNFNGDMLPDQLKEPEARVAFNFFNFFTSEDEIVTISQNYQCFLKLPN